MVVLFLASALIGSGILFHHKRILTYIAAAGVLFEGELLLTTLLHRTLFQYIDGPTFFLIASVLYTTIFLALYKQWKHPYSTPGSGLRDMYAAILLFVVLAAAYPIVQHNGFHGEDFILHGFYNGDVVTFASLVQKSFDTSLLVTQNPFSGNGSLEYPTLLHGAVSDLFSLLHVYKDWLYFWSIMTFIQICITIPMFFLVWDTVFPEPVAQEEKWLGVSSRHTIYILQTLISAVAIGLSFDSFSYPQSHFFLIGIFLGVIALLAKALSLSGKQQIFPVTTGATLAALLLLSNTVTGTAAAGAVGVFCIIRIFDKKRSPMERGFFLLFAFAILVFMKNASVGRTTLSHLHFSVSSASDMIRAGLPTLFVLGAALYSLARKQYIAITAAAISSLGFIIFFLSDRNIVTENASRFLYHGFLIGSVLLLPLAVQYLYFIKRELLFTLRPMSERIGGWIAVASGALIILLPIGISTASTYVSLLGPGEYHVSVSDRTLLWWIDENVKSNEVIIVNPNEPFLVPLFTGRAMLRAHDYWLSQDDEISQDLEAAYTGNTSAQKNIIKQGSYIILTSEEVKQWNTSSFKKMMASENAAIYKI